MHLATICDRFFTVGILFLIPFTPFAFGAVHPWAYVTMEAVIFGLVVVWCVKVIVRGKELGVRSGWEKTDTPHALRLTPYVVPLALFIALCVFQLTPLPPGLLRALSPQTFEAYTQVLPGWPDTVPYSEVDQMSEIRGQKSEDIDQRSEVRGQRSRGESKDQGAHRENAIDATNTINASLESVRGDGLGVRRDLANNAINTKNSTNSINPQSEIQNPKSKIENSPGFLRLTPNASRSPLVPETWLPLSLAPFLSKIDLLKFAAYAALFFLIWLYPFQKPFADFEFRNSDSGFFILSPEQRFLRSVFFAILGTGLLVATVGFIERFTWNGKILWFFVPYSWGQPMPGVPRASGPFVNPDHFANYLSVIFPIALSCALFRTSIVSKLSQQALRFFCALTTFLLFTGILLSISRAGWISALLGLVVLAWLSPWGGGRGRSEIRNQRSEVRSQGPEHISDFGFRISNLPSHDSRLETGRSVNSKSDIRNSKFARMARLSLITVCIFLVVSLFFIGSEGREQVDARLGETFGQDLSLSGRMDIWKDSVRMIRDFPVFGVGLGAWPELGFRYQRGPWSADFAREAHNDYVQLLAETGAIGFGVLAWFFIAGGKQIVRGMKKVSKKNLPLMAGILAALGVMAFHEWFDFNLKIPANAFLFTVLFALGLRLTRSQRSEIGDQQLASPLSRFPASQQMAIRAQWAAVNDVKGEELGVRGLKRLAPHASRLTPYAGVAIAAALVVCALTQEQSLKRPESVAEAKERIFLRPAKASSHVAMLRVAGDEAPLSWQLSEYKAGLWIEPTNPYSRDRYASTLLSMGRTDEGLSEITRSVAESPSMKTHEYLKDDSFLRFSAAEQSAVEEGFKQAIARGYPEAVNGLAGFYKKLNRFEDQGRLYEEAALKEADSAKKAELLVNAGLAYLKEAGSREQRAGSETQRVAGKEVSAKGKEQNIEKIRNSESSILPSALTPSQSASASELRAPSSMLHAAAERLFRNAIAANPTDARAYQQLIMILGPRKDLAGAKEIISQGIKNGAPPLSLYLSLAEAAQKTGSEEEIKAALKSAKAEVEKLIKNGESPYTLYIALADGSRRAGDRDQETAALLKSLDLQPRSADTLSRLANLYFEKQNYDRAALYLNRIAKINPDSANIYYSLAAAEEARYRFADAGRAYARAVELAPNNADYRRRYDEFRARVERNRTSEQR